MENRTLEFISSTRHFIALSALQANQHTKFDRAMQIFASKCNVTSERYHTIVYRVFSQLPTYNRLCNLATSLNNEVGQVVKQIIVVKIPCKLVATYIIQVKGFLKLNF